MGNLLLKVVLMIAIPAIVFLAGSGLMGKLSERKSTKAELKDAGLETLSMRRQGYDTTYVDSVFTVLAEKDRNEGSRFVANERRFLVMDLAFPFFYGGAFLAALLIGWSALGKPFDPVWLVLPIAVMVAADLVETLLQLGQLRSFTESGTLDAGWIRVASIATIVKIWLFIATAFAIVGLVVATIVHYFTSKS
jgi:hypothetical protein